MRQRRSASPSSYVSAPLSGDANPPAGSVGSSNIKSSASTARLAIARYLWLLILLAGLQLPGSNSAVGTPASLKSVGSDAVAALVEPNKSRREHHAP